MIGIRGAWTLFASVLALPACNSDVPVSAIAQVPSGVEVTVTRVATHPFLARFNLKVTVRTPGGCLATSELFPDTGGVSRRNLYRGPAGQLYVIGQFDVRRFDAVHCRIELMEFRSLEPGLTFLGSFDVEAGSRWTFVPVDVRPERPFQPL